MPRRVAISIEQKQALRAHRRAFPTFPNIELKRWFEAKYQQVISTSSVSEILSAKYTHLDNPINRTQSQKRFRQEFWPELEDALFQWIQRAEATITISSYTIREKAEFFWMNIPQYQGLPMPSFSNGWLQGFQSRRGIAHRIQHGELNSSVSVPAEMQSIRQAIAHYEPRDIYNCDETGLLWKLTPDRSLSTRTIPGRKREKARVTIHLCCNMDGSDKVPLWFIGQAQKPHAFRRTNINIQNLGVYWRANKKAWMVSSIMEEWLRWFDLRMAGRKVVLLLDNFSAHICAVNKINSTLPLQNTLIIWLPPNSTSEYQPLDQGIIRTWKHYWRRDWVRYMLHEYEAGRDPLSTVDILQAIRWGIAAWEFHLKITTISNCFNKGLSLRGAEIPIQAEDTTILDIEAGLQRLSFISAIENPMDIQHFLNPEEEIVTDSSESIDLQILAQFQAPDDEEEEEDPEVMPKVSSASALEAVQLLQLYQEQQEEGDIKLIHTLNKLRMEIQGGIAQNRQQGDIRSHFSI